MAKTVEYEACESCGINRQVKNSDLCSDCDRIQAYGTCHHRSFTIVSDRMEDGAEQSLYAECDECGQKKSALVDWTRDWSTCGPVSEGEFETNALGE